MLTVRVPYYFLVHPLGDIFTSFLAELAHLHFPHWFQVSHYTFCLFICLLLLKLVIPDSLLYTAVCRLMPLVFSCACAVLCVYSRVLWFFHDPTVNSLLKSSVCLLFGFGFFITLGNGKEVWNEGVFWILSLHLVNWNFKYQCRHPNLKEPWWRGLLPGRHTKIIFVREFWTNSHLLHAAVTDCRARKAKCTRGVSGVPPGGGLCFKSADSEPGPSPLWPLKDPSKLGWMGSGQMGPLGVTQVAWGRVRWAPLALHLHHKPWVEEIKLEFEFFVLVCDADVKLLRE